MGPNELTAIRMSVLFLASMTLICNARGRAVGDTLCFRNSSDCQELGGPAAPHLQDVIQGLGAKRPASVEQSVAGLLHLVLLPPRGLGVPGLGALQTLAAALKLLAHLLEPAHVSGRWGERGRGGLPASHVSFSCCASEKRSDPEARDSLFHEALQLRLHRLCGLHQLL